MALTSHGLAAVGAIGGQGFIGMVDYGSAASVATCLFTGSASGLAQLFGQIRNLSVARLAIRAYGIVVTST